MTISTNFLKEFSICSALLKGSLLESDVDAVSIRTAIMEQKEFPLLSSCAHAINFLKSSSHSNRENLLEEFSKMNKFVHENNLRFPLEEMIIEEAIKLEEDEGAMTTTPTTNTTGVAKVELPIGETVKRKLPKEDV